MKHANNPTGTWSEDAVAALRQYWTDGLSCSQIAKRLLADGYPDYTRSAVIGKVHRLKLAARKDRQFQSYRKPRPKAAKIGRPKKDRATPSIRISVVTGTLLAGDNAPRSPALADLGPPAPVGQRVTIADIEAHHCRWPIGDPRAEGFHFCGGAKMPGRPYCLDHARRSCVAVIDTEEIRVDRRKQAA